ncbi:MAG: sigma-E processing peptidase SpoIIGA [Clostridia bacterium]|nr:sigma-E processing peptidase SpoIIGA [Clostridia bacterium]
MPPVIYIDMLFLLNLLMDTITICATALILKRNISLSRVFFASGLLSLYSSAMFFPYIHILYTLAGKMLVLSLATAIAFPSHSFGQLFKNVVVFFFVTAVFGGIIFALVFATNFGTTINAAVSNGEIYLDIKASTLVFALTISYICIYTISYVKHRNFVLNPNIAKLEVALFSKSIHIFAFADTGCTICDPLRNMPAIIISPESAKKLLPARIFKELSDVSDFSVLGKYASRYCKIPFYTIDQKHGLLNGFIPDKIILNKKSIENCIIAIADNPLSQTSQFDAIFNPSILSESNELTLNNT